MKKTKILLVAVTVSMVLLATACGGGQQAAPAAPEPTLAPPPVQVQAPTQAPAPPAQSFAPVCQTTTSSCAAPDVKENEPTETYCVKKIPYVNFLIPEGTTFEVLDKSGDYSCADSGTIVDGKHVLTCTGKQLYTFELKLTNSSCGGSNLVTGTGQCQDGYGFDAAQGCCAPVTAGGGGSTVIRVNMGACPLPQ
jgi:hypothetical protein